jgi:putative PIN family toxin of toxin-antitoxin system
VKVFLDTNVIVSAFATRGLCADLFQAIVAEHQLVLSESVLGEVRTVLTRKLRVPRKAVEELEALLRGQAVVVGSLKGSRMKGLDDADAAVVAEAVAGKVDVLVSGDQDLLKLPQPPVVVVSPRGLWDVLRRAT